MNGNGKTRGDGWACAECGWRAAKWVGRCGECQAWGTVVETTSGARTPTAPVAAGAAVPIANVSEDCAHRAATSVPEFDRVLGGGLVPGAVVLLAGEPGVGKSTLLLDVAARAASAERTVLYVTGEETAGQVKARAARIDAIADGLLLASENDLGRVLGLIEAVSPSMLMVDSVQTIASTAVDGAPGGVAQVREVASSLIAAAKSRSMPTVLVGHVTKDGTVAGPRTLEHLVDVVCQFEGERHTRLRMVRAVKNRYGPTDEVGCFEMSEHGVTSLADPSGLFLSSRGAPLPGCCVTVALEGRRPLATEVQALVAEQAGKSPRRTGSGIDSGRLSLLLAVLERRLGNGIAAKDVYAATVGGVRVTETAADLATALAVISSWQDTALPAGLVAFGELGLTGEIRPVVGASQRIREAARLGFTMALTPVGAIDGEPPAGLTVLEVGALADAYGLAMTLAPTASALAVPDLRLV